MSYLAVLREAALRGVETCGTGEVVVGSGKREGGRVELDLRASEFESHAGSLSKFLDGSGRLSSRSAAILRVGSSDAW